MFELKLKFIFIGFFVGVLLAPIIAGAYDVLGDNNCKVMKQSNGFPEEINFFVPYSLGTEKYECKVLGINTKINLRYSNKDNTGDYDKPYNYFDGYNQNDCKSGICPALFVAYTQNANSLQLRFFPKQSGLDRRYFEKPTEGTTFRAKYTSSTSNGERLIRIFTDQYEFKMANGEARAPTEKFSKVSGACIVIREKEIAGITFPTDVAIPITPTATAFQTCTFKIPGLTDGDKLNIEDLSNALFESQANTQINNQKFERLNSDKYDLSYKNQQLTISLSPQL